MRYDGAWSRQGSRTLELMTPKKNTFFPGDNQFQTSFIENPQRNFVQEENFSCDCTLALVGPANGMDGDSGSVLNPAGPAHRTRQPGATARETSRGSMRPPNTLRIRRWTKPMFTSQPKGTMKVVFYRVSNLHLSNDDSWPEV